MISTKDIEKDDIIHFFEELDINTELLTFITPSDTYYEWKAIGYFDVVAIPMLPKVKDLATYHIPKAKKVGSDVTNLKKHILSPMTDYYIQKIE